MFRSQSVKFLLMLSLCALATATNFCYQECPFGYYYDCLADACKPCCYSNYNYPSHYDACFEYSTDFYQCNNETDGYFCYWNSNSQCCYLSCPDGFYLDKDRCTCKCDLSKQCPDYYILDPKSCDCECDASRICPPYYQLDKSSCECVCDRSCSEGYYLNLDSCACLCDTSKTCPPYYRLDEKKCECVCDTSRVCPQYYRLDERSCGCVCARTCNSGYYLNRDTCTCFRNSEQCTGNCEEGYYLNDADCQCYPCCYNHYLYPLHASKCISFKNSKIDCLHPTDNLKCLWQSSCPACTKTCQTGYYLNKSRCQCVPCCYSQYSSQYRQCISYKRSRSRCLFPHDGHICHWSRACNY